MGVHVVDDENENHSAFPGRCCGDCCCCCCCCCCCLALGTVIAACYPLHLVDDSHKSSHRLCRESHMVDSQGQSQPDPELLDLPFAVASAVA